MKNQTQEVNLCCGKQFYLLTPDTPLFYGNGAFAMLGGRAKAMKSFLLRIIGSNKINGKTEYSTKAGTIRIASL